MSINVDSLAREIVKNLEGYTENVRKGIDEEKKRVTEKGIAALQSDSPRRHGKYKKSWDKKELKAAGQNGVNIIYNKKQYRLTHLLENGHAKRNNRGTVAAKPHIKAVEKMIIDEFTEAAERVITNGG